MSTELGRHGTDIITGFAGIATEYSENIHGRRKYFLQPKCRADNPEMPRGVWLDEARIEFFGGAQSFEIDELIA